MELLTDIETTELQLIAELEDYIERYNIQTYRHLANMLREKAYAGLYSPQAFDTWRALLLKYSQHFAAYFDYWKEKR